MTTDYKVVVVVDEQFGERLALIPRGIPVWIVDTPVNKPVAQRLWAQRPNELTGVTTFTALGKSAEETLLAELDTVDDHHGQYAATPRYTILEVIGASLTPRIKAELEEYGFQQFRPNEEGFTAARNV